MSYFTGGISSQPSMTAPIYDGHIEPTGSALMDISMESLREDYQIAAAMQIADAQLTLTAVTESVGAADIALESIVGSTITKIKDSLKKLWAKVKAWFKSMRDRLNLIFTKGKKFLEKYREQIKNKPTTGFEYTGTVWTMKAGSDAVVAAIKGLSGIVEDKSAEIAADVDGIIAAGKASNASTEKGEASLDELKDAIYDEVAKRLGFDGSNANATDVTKAAKEAFRNGKSDSDTEEIKGFDKISKDDLIHIIEKNDEITRAVKDAETAADRLFSKNLERITRAETKVSSIKDEGWTSEGMVIHTDDEDHIARLNRVRSMRRPSPSTNEEPAAVASGGSGSSMSGAQIKARVTNYISRLSTATKLASTINNSLSVAAGEAAAAAAKEAESVLKRFLNYKGAKESSHYTGGSNYTDPVIENLMNLTGI